MLAVRDDGEVSGGFRFVVLEASHPCGPKDTTRKVAMVLGASSPTAMDTINLLAAAVTLVLGVVAIILSIVFYQMSSAQADQAKENAGQIKSSVDRLEKLFDRLYADTFSMMRETVTDMRQHVWRGVTTNGSEEQVTELKDELLKKVGEVSHSLGVTDTNLSQLRAALAPMLSQALDAARTVDLHSELTYDTLSIGMSFLTEEGVPPRAGYIARILQFDNRVTNSDLLTTSRPEVDSIFVNMLDMRQAGLVVWEGEHSAISAGTRIEITQKGKEWYRDFRSKRNSDPHG